jgi:hypothetical protein
MTAPHLSKSLSAWDQERVAIQRNVLLRDDPRLLMIWAKKMDLKHWHVGKQIIVGERSDTCPLCRQ